MQIIVENLTKSYEREIIFQSKNISFDKADRVALMGKSGCGKTTFLRLLLGLEKPDSGQIRLEKNTVFSAVFQQARLCPTLSAMENILLVSRKSPAKIMQAEQFLRQMQLAETEWHKPAGLLSGGQRQRVAVARALIIPFDVLVLDEALKGLDEQSKNATVALITECTQGKTLLAVTHNTAEAALLQTKVYRFDSP